MSKTVNQLLAGEWENHILPFFWQHGEDEKTLRTYMQAIYDANCRAVCVESRPHPDFCGEKWWQDMDVILDEAQKRGMQVWILDDSHFPTGFANGAVKNAPDALKRRSMYFHTFRLRPGQKRFRCDFQRIAKKIPTTPMGALMTVLVGDRKETYQDEQMISVSALVPGETLPVAVDWKLTGRKLEADLPNGAQKLYVTFTTRNAGVHRTYINMLDMDSCRLQIDAVYEPHYAHYQEHFGKTIAGFFSDEPEIGNGVYFNNEITMGTNFDYPWSRGLEAELASIWGENWRLCLPLLWDNDTDETERARIRYDYMDTVTRLVETCFSKQIGTWCEERNVQYIGHMIEDGNQHARLGASLGHFFRGQSGQHMAGIDDIGGQVLPQKEDAPPEGFGKLTGRDGEFYHYLLGKLAASSAAIDPKKQGRSMCEIFGNYGWSEGPRLEKYLADHFMVQGVNYYVPHAFSPKPYPDSDCPPHFYAHGHNPQYRHFAQLMAYMNRVCSLISGGKPVVRTAVLYHGDCEWAGETMLSQKVTRLLMENQVECQVLPADVFVERERFRTDISENGFVVNGLQYDVILVPAARHIPQALADALGELKKVGCQVIFLDRLPEGILDGNVRNLEEVLSVVPRDMLLEPQNWRIRAFHYKGAEEFYYLVNEDDKPYQGTLRIPRIPEGYLYDAWENQAYALECRQDANQTQVSVSLRPGESLIVVVGVCDAYAEKAVPTGNPTRLSGIWTRSVCKSIDYPNFTDEKIITSFGDYGKENKNFSGLIAYETTFSKPRFSRTILEITDAGEDVEVFVNGISAGIQVLPP